MRGAQLLENSFEDWKHHGGGGGVADPHGEEPRWQHEPKHQPEQFKLHVSQTFVQLKPSFWD